MTPISQLGTLNFSVNTQLFSLSYPSCLCFLHYSYCVEVQELAESRGKRSHGQDPFLLARKEVGEESACMKGFSLCVTYVLNV